MKRAVLLLNLGGPETQDDVKPFLYALFDDPEIIRIRFAPLRHFVAWMISTLRAEKSRALYQTLGGGSPIRKLTDDQAAALEKRLKDDGRPVLVRTAFSCSRPLIPDVMKELSGQGVTEFLALPLYPQYSFTTTKSALDRVRAVAPKGARVYEVKSYPTHPLFIKANAEAIRESLKTFSPGEVHLVFSAHSIPEKLVTKLGDPYKDEVTASVEGVIKELGWTGPYHLAWQSKLGPVKWLAPATSEVVEKLGEAGVKRILVIPIAFVTDHIETLEEIDKEIREEAEEKGVAEFRMTPGLNTRPSFIAALADLAARQDNFWRD